MINFVMLPIEFFFLWKILSKVTNISKTKCTEQKNLFEVNF